MTQPLSNLKATVAAIDNIELLEAMALQEARIGGRRIIRARMNQIQKAVQMQEQYQASLSFERKYKGEVICGVDEVGRGPLAGPVVACAAILNDDHHYIGLTDSKKLSPKKRMILEASLTEQLCDFSIGIATVEEIDRINIYEASKLAMRRAVEQLKVKPTVLLIDAMELNTGLVEEAIIKGDEKSISISAASVIAKEYRDRLMAEMDDLYPGYDFKNNAGYGTKKHLEGLNQLGISPIHRKTFEPIKTMLAF